MSQESIEDQIQELKDEISGFAAEIDQLEYEKKQAKKKLARLIGKRE